MSLLKYESKLANPVRSQMCFVFFLQYLDKQSLSYAGVFGLIEDLNMTSSQYSWSSSIFYVGQLVSEYPFIYLMSRLPLTKFVGATVYVSHERDSSFFYRLFCSCLSYSNSPYTELSGASYVCASQLQPISRGSPLYDSSSASVKAPSHPPLLQ
jgi:hypothetical protein